MYLKMGGRQPLTKEWRRKSLKRHPDLVFRKATRLNPARRTTAHDAVNGFYENLVKLVEESNITAETLWNTVSLGFWKQHPYTAATGPGGVRVAQEAVPETVLHLLLPVPNHQIWKKGVPTGAWE